MYLVYRELEGNVVETIYPVHRGHEGNASGETIYGWKGVLPVHIGGVAIPIYTGGGLFISSHWGEVVDARTNSKE